MAVRNAATQALRASSTSISLTAHYWAATAANLRNSPRKLDLLADR
jgi:hypothetical protein